MPSSKISKKSSLVNRNNVCGGPIKAGLAPRSTNFNFSMKPNHRFRGKPFVDNKKSSDYSCLRNNTKGNDDFFDFSDISDPLFKNLPDVHNMHNFYSNEERVMPIPNDMQLHPTQSFAFLGLRFKNPFKNNEKQNPNFDLLKHMIYYVGFPVKKKGQNIIIVSFDFTNPNDLSDLETLDSTSEEKYSINFNSQTNSSEIIISTSNCLGALRALQTLKQLVRKGNGELGNTSGFNVPLFIQITDEPKFKHRGVLIDTGRQYISIELIKRTIRNMGSVKLNVLHWHLIDMHVFPFKPLSPYDSLFDLGDAEDPNNLKHEPYTTDVIKDIINFAHYCGVRVIIELDSPGHTYAGWINSDEYSDLLICHEKEHQSRIYAQEPPAGSLNIKKPGKGGDPNKVKGIFKDLFKQLFEKGCYKDDYIHLGGDESKPTCIDEDDSETYLKELSNELSSELQNGKPRKSILWEDSLGKFIQDYSVDDQQTDMSELPYEQDKVVIETWLGPHTKAITNMGYDVIVSGVPLYLDVGRGTFFMDEPSWGSWASWFLIYQFDPLDGVKEERTNQVLGSEVCLWGETIDEMNFETLLWPRAAAHAESTWNRIETLNNKDEQKEVYDRVPMEGKDVSADLTLFTYVLKRLRFLRTDMVNSGVRASPLAPVFCEGSQLCDQFSDNLNIKWPTDEFNAPTILKDSDTQPTDPTTNQDNLQYECPANSIGVITNVADDGTCTYKCMEVDTDKQNKPSIGLQDQRVTYCYDKNNWLLYSYI